MFKKILLKFKTVHDAVKRHLTEQAFDLEKNRYKYKGLVAQNEKKKKEEDIARKMVGTPSNPSISYIISPTVEQETRTANKYSRLQQMQFVEFKKKEKRKKN